MNISLSVVIHQSQLHGVMEQNRITPTHFSLLQNKLGNQRIVYGLFDPPFTELFLCIEGVVTMWGKSDQSDLNYVQV